VCQKSSKTTHTLLNVCEIVNSSGIFSQSRTKLRCQMTLPLSVTILEFYIRGMRCVPWLMASNCQSLSTQSQARSIVRHGVLLPRLSPIWQIQRATYQACLCSLSIPNSSIIHSIPLSGLDFFFNTLLIMRRVASRLQG
jgi:hypothetical protein